MRLKTFFVSMIAGLAFVACSNEEDFNQGNGNGANGEPQYLTVSINATGALSPAGRSLEGEYEEGADAENAVTSVRFYFFDGDNNAAKVKGENGDTYFDVAMEDAEKDDMPNVEKILKATLVIQTPLKDKAPASIVAVVNPTSDLGAVKDLNELNAVIADHSNTTSFIMSSSVYASSQAKMEAVDVAGHLYSTPDAAKQNPVVIHVERVLAKASLTVGLEATENGLYKTSSNASETYDGKEIYVKFLGWNVTATAGTSRLMKEINPNWSANLFGTSLLWNTADYFRSFWAVNPPADKMTYNYGPFNTAGNTAAANALISFQANEATPNYTYLQENASDDFTNGTNPSHPSQVIIAAQLVDKNGNPMEFAEYAGERTTVDGLIKKYAAASGLWTENADGTGKVQIDVNDIVLKTATDAHVADQNTAGRYKVYAQLTPAAAAKKWYKSDAANAPEVDANAALKDLGGAKVWTNGYTYYYFDIRHLNGTATEDATIGKYGVVRNHVYAARINSLSGLGTPVYNPGEIIYPEHPQNDETYIAAEIRVLSWRIVNQDIDLEW